MPKISASALADLYSSSGFDSSANYGFNLLPAEPSPAPAAQPAPAIVPSSVDRAMSNRPDLFPGATNNRTPLFPPSPEDDFIRFQTAAYSFANADRDENHRKIATQHFGAKMLNPAARDTPYWFGQAVLSQMGHDNIFAAYQAFGVPIPADATDETELISTLGHNLLQRYRSDYDKRKCIQETSAKQTQDHFTKLRDGSLSPDQLSPEAYQEIIDITGFSPHDIALAGKIAREQAQDTLGDKMWSSVAAFAASAMGDIGRLPHAAGELLKGNFSNARYVMKHNRGQKAIRDTQEYLDVAWATVERRAELMRLAKNPLHVRQLATAYYTEREEAYQKELMALSRIARDVNNAANSIIKGGQYAVKGALIPITGHTLDRQSLMQGSALESNLTDASAQARANIAQQGHGSMLEEAATTVAAIAPYMNPYTAVLSSGDLFTKNAGRGFSTIADYEGNMDTAYFTEASAKGAAQAAITWGTRAVGYGMFSKVAAKVAPRMLNSTLGYYTTNAAFTGANFATVVPAMDAALNHLWDEAFVSHVELQTGGKQMHELTKNLQSPRYWGVQMMVGGILAGSSTYTHYNAKASRDALITYGKLQGLSDREANSIVATTPLTQAPEAIIDALRDKIKNNPQQALADRVANLNAFLSEEQQQAAHTLGRSILADNARLATIQLNGFSVEVDPNDPNYVLITTDGHYDEATQSFKPGDKTTRMSMQDAEICLASIFGTQEAVTARAMRSALANGTMLDAAKKVFGDRLAIEAIAEPLSLDAAVKRGKDAESLQKERARALVDESKGEDGKPSLSESEALKRAAAEKAPTLHPTQTIAEMIQFGKNAEQRIAQAKALLGKDADKADFSTRAFVVTPKNADAATVTRILKIAEGASTREIAEEYAHMYLEDYIANTGTDYADTWRLLHALSSSIKGEDNFSLTTLQQTHPELAAKLTSENPASFDSLSVIDQDLIRHDVQEGFAALTLSDLRYRAQQGDVSLPDFARPLFDADLVMRSVMQNELATAAALNESRELGLFDENAQRLLRAPADAIAKALSEIQNPTPTQYYNAYQRASQFFGSALLDHTPEQTIADLDRWDALAQTPSTEPSPLEEAYEADIPPVEREAKQRALDEAIAEEAALPENEGLTTEEVANKVARKVTEAKKRDSQDTDAHPDTEYDPSLGAYAYKTQDKTSKLPCRYAIISLDKLSIMPNFKIGSDETTGEVNELTGAFMPDHPPISVYHDPADGSLLVMSGRHRLAHARRCGMAEIACYVYDKTPERDLVWAQKNDVEWNIRDEQASPTEIALYIRGELIPGVPALTSAEIAKNNIYARKNSKAEKGFIIGTKAIDDVIYALRDDAITEQQAYAIANTSSDPTVQRYGLRDAQNNVASRGIVINMSLHASRLEYLQARGEYRQADFFGEMQDHADSVLQNYILDYAKKQAARYDKRIKAKNLEKIVVEDPNALEDSALRIDKTLHKRNAKLKNKPTDPALLKDMWLSVWQHMDVFGEEIDAAFKKDHPKEWQELQDRKAAAETTLQEAIDSRAVDPDKPLYGTNATVLPPEFDFSVQAMHVSPHDFKEFSTDFMGSGEGAQAFGWGLYFMTNEAVNKHYHNQFTRKSSTVESFIYNGKELTRWEASDLVYDKIRPLLPRDEVYIIPERVGGWEEPVGSYVSSLVEQGYDISYQLKKARKQLEKEIKYSFSDKKYRDKYYEAYKALADRNKDISKIDLSNYGKHLEEEEWVPKLLLVKALEVAESLNISYNWNIEKPAINYRVEILADDHEFFMWDEQIPSTIMESSPIKFDKDKQIKGEEFYRLLTEKLGSKKAASMWLAERGYKGIKYFDGESRKRGEGTYNYVIFDGKDIKITEVNRTGIWDLTEGWELSEERAAELAELEAEQEALYAMLGNKVRGDLSNIPTLFSTSAAHLERWQAVPTAELGELGHFGDNIERKTSLLTGEGRAINAYNERIVRMNNALKRRLGELRHLNTSGKADSEEAIKLYAEMAAIYNQITHILPQGYRFGLEPYSIFFDTYADLWGKGDTKHAVANIPMGTTWQRKMYAAFENQFERILTGELSTEHESAFFDLFNQFTFNADIQHLRNEYVRLRAEAIEEVNARFDDHTTREYKRARTEALTKVYDTLKAKNPAVFEALYKAVGELRAHRLMDKFLARVTLKLDQFRKDITLSSITKAINRLTPRHEKNGKPIKGTVDPTTYNTALTNYRLLLLTPGQKEAIDAANESALLESADPNSIIKVTTFDTDGKEITFEVSKQQYETYACFEDMSPEYAETAAAAMGTLIKNGKEAWQLAQEQAKKAVEDFCAPALQEYGETLNERKTRKKKEALKRNASGSYIVNGMAGFFNDMQLFDYIASNQSLQSFHAVTDRIARAHTYLEQAETQSQNFAYEAAARACGSRKRKDIERWCEYINTNKECNITLVRQAPDFTAKHTASLRDSLLKRLFFYVHRTKNFNANKFAAALHLLLQSNTLPPQIAAEVKAKYGNIGNRDKYKGIPSNAFQQLFTADKFGHLRNFKKAVKERAEESLKKYNEDLKDKGISREPETITSFSPNVAAYHVLLSEQSDYAENMRLQGYTPEVLQQLREIAGEDMMQYAYDLRTNLNARTPQLKEIYEATYGTPFPQVENYFRAFFDVKNQESMDSILAGMSFGQGKADGAITIFRTRVKHNAAVSLDMSTTGAYLIGMKQQDNIIAYSDPVTHTHLATMLRQVLSYKDSKGKDMTEALTKALGESVVGAIRVQTDNMMRLFGYNDKYEKALNKTISDFSKSSAVSILNGRVSSLAKNIMAVLNTLGGSDKAGVLEWLLSVWRASWGWGKISREEMAKQPFIKHRYKGFAFDSNREMLFSLTDEKITHGATDPNRKAGHTLFGKFDRWASNLAATALYDAHYRALQSESPELPHEILHAESLATVERALYKKGQPMDWRSRALNASRVSSFKIGLYYLGGEAINTFGNCVQLFAKAAATTARKDATSKQKLRAWTNATAAWLFSGALMSLLNWGYYAMTDDEETWKKRGFISHMFWGSMLGPISGIPLISDLASLGVEFGHTLLGYKEPYLANSALLPLGDLRRACNEIPHIWNSKKSGMDKLIALNNVARNLCTIVLFSQIRPTSKTGTYAKGAAIAGTLILNVLDFLLRTTRAIDERFLE